MSSSTRHPYPTRLSQQSIPRVQYYHYKSSKSTTSISTKSDKLSPPTLSIPSPITSNETTPTTSTSSSPTSLKNPLLNYSNTPQHNSPTSSIYDVHFPSLSPLSSSSQTSTLPTCGSPSHLVQSIQSKNLTYSQVTASSSQNCRFTTWDEFLSLTSRPDLTNESNYNQLYLLLKTQIKTVYTISTNTKYPNTRHIHNSHTSIELTPTSEVSKLSDINSSQKQKTLPTENNMVAQSRETLDITTSNNTINTADSTSTSEPSKQSDIMSSRPQQTSNIENNKDAGNETPDIPIPTIINIISEPSKQSDIMSSRPQQTSNIENNKDAGNETPDIPILTIPIPSNIDTLNSTITSISSTNSDTNKTTTTTDSKSTSEPSTQSDIMSSRPQQTFNKENNKDAGNETPDIPILTIPIPSNIDTLNSSTTSNSSTNSDTTKITTTTTSDNDNSNNAINIFTSDIHSYLLTFEDPNTFSDTTRQYATSQTLQQQVQENISYFSTTAQSITSLLQKFDALPTNANKAKTTIMKQLYEIINGLVSYINSYYVDVDDDMLHFSHYYYPSPHFQSYFDIFFQVKILNILQLYLLSTSNYSYPNNTSTAQFTPSAIIQLSQFYKAFTDIPKAHIHKLDTLYMYSFYIFTCTQPQGDSTTSTDTLQLLHSYCTQHPELIFHYVLQHCPSEDNSPT